MPSVEQFLYLLQFPHLIEQIDYDKVCELNDKSLKPHAESQYQKQWNYPLHLQSQSQKIALLQMQMLHLDLDLVEEVYDVLNLQQLHIPQTIFYY